MDIKILGSKAKEAARVLARAGSNQKNKALEAVAGALVANTDKILSANKEDIDRAQAAGMAPAMVDRLTLTPERINGMAQGVRELVAAADPVGRVLYGETRPNGLKIRKVTVPLGVIAVIFESRPNVTADAAALCLKRERRGGGGRSAGGRHIPCGGHLQRQRHSSYAYERIR